MRWRGSVREGAAVVHARRCLAALAGLLALLPALPAWSVPAFARQLGVPCAVCHTVAFGPALTPYGRNFKLHAYALGTQKTIPLSADLVGAFTHTETSLPALPHFSDNNNLSVDNIDAFFAGRIADHVGAFVQVSYDGIIRHTAWSNLDARYAQDFKLGGIDTLLGLSVNNSPSVQDPWNSTPVWQFPYPSVRLANGPAAQPQLDAAYAQTVLGGTLYTLIDNAVYLEAGGYRRLADRVQKDFGIENPAAESRIDGTAPYWRLALQKTSGPHYVSAGLVGFDAHAQPGAGPLAGTNNYSDFGYDATYQFANGGPHTFNFNASYIHESQRLFATAEASGADVVRNHLDTLNVSAQYGYRQTYALTVAFFNTVGNANTVLSHPAPFFGSANGKPDSRYLQFQLECVPFGKAGSLASPWLNLRVGVQYTDYLRLNGGDSNYDGFGHPARDNNTVFLYVWTAI